jgi:hypothetical protein
MTQETRVIIRSVLWLLAAIPLSYTVVPLNDYLSYMGGKQFVLQSWLILPISCSLGGCLATPVVFSVLKGKTTNTGSRRVLLGLISFSLLVMPLMVSLLLARPIQPAFTKGMLDRLNHDVDSQELRKWAESELSKHWDGRRDQSTDSQIENDLPVAIRTLSRWPPNVSVEILEGDVVVPHLGIVWGSGFGHWGILLANPDFVPPSVPGYYFSKWRPGIYVYFSD